MTKRKSEQFQATVLRPQLKLVIFTSAVVFVCIALGTAYLIDGSVTLHALSRISATTILIVLGLSLANYYIRFLRWEWYISLQTQERLPHFQHLLIYLAGFSLTTTPGKLGEMVRGSWLLKRNIPIATTASILIIERSLDVVALSLISLAGVITIYSQDSPSMIVFLILMIFLVFFSLLLIPKVLSFLTPRWTWLSVVENSSNQILNFANLAVGTMLGGVAWFAEGIGLWVVVNDMIAPETSNMLQLVGVYGISILAGAISLLPGGLGATELTMAGILTLTGMSAGASIAATLVCRLVTLWFGVVVGIFAVLSLELTTLAHLRINAEQTEEKK
jgi:glycosyltransferase 2 family protein